MIAKLWELQGAESQAMRVPVVASRIGGIPESVVDRKPGLVPPRDSSALAQAIIHILKDDRLRKELGHEGRLHVQQKFDWNQTLADTIAVFKEVA